MTLDELQKIVTGYNLLCERYYPYIVEAMKEFEINNSLRKAAFIAQVAHETGCFKFMREIWGPTVAQTKYEGRKDLGNIKPGDGKKYRGRGAIQLTGRANYTKYSKLLDVNLVDNPEVAGSPPFAFRIAGCFWEQNGLNLLADEGSFEAITERINGGLNGYAERKAFYERGLEVIKCYRT